LLRSLSDDQYKDIVKVLSGVPNLTMTITTEVVDDEEQHVVTAGSIITVTCLLERGSLLDFMEDGRQEDDPEEAEDGEVDEPEVLEDEDEKEGEKKEEKKAAWKKPQKKKAGKKAGGGGKQKQKPKQKPKPTENNVVAVAPTGDGPPKPEESASESEAEDSGSEDSESGRDKKDLASEDDMEDQEWAKFQKKLNKREKALEGRSKVSHSVHCPYFTDDKQEHWWVYISDRKTHSLVTPPYHVTSLVHEEEVELKFTAPGKPGHYTFTVCVRSDSYLGVDLMEDIKLDVQEAREAPTDHPQWDFEVDDGEDEGKEDSEESEYATDEDFDDDEWDEE